MKEPTGRNQKSIRPNSPKTPSVAEKSSAVNLGCARRVSSAFLGGEYFLLFVTVELVKI
jgi:hypothetical protein